MECLRIYICGAHSTGKSTLLNDLKSCLDMKFEEEVARTIIKNHNWKRDDFLPSTNPDRFVQLNKEILEAQIEIDSQNTASGTDFICDRGVDPFIYVDLYVGNSKTQTLYQQVDGVNNWLDRMKRSLVFVLYPHKECILDDGVRLPPSIEELCKFTDLLEDFLSEHDIGYRNITVLDRQQRVNDIIEVVRQTKPSVLRTGSIFCGTKLS